MRSFYLFLILTCATVFGSFSQSKTLKSFTSYGSCYQGLKSTLTGEIIWPAEFESLHQMWDGDYWNYPRNYFWRAEKNGSFGIIESNGELIIPFSYKRFTIYSEAIAAEDDSAAYLFSLSGDLTLKLNGYSWIRPTPSGYIVEREGKIGFTSFDLNEVLPTDYDKIYFCQIVESREGVREMYSDRFLMIEKNEKKSVFDLVQNKWILPWTDDYIYQNWVRSCPESDAVFHLSNNDRPETRVINSFAVEVLVYNHHPSVQVELTSLDSCGTESHQMAYVERNRKMKVLNVKTGKYSNEHIEVYPLKGHSIYFDKKRWGVIDPDFNELKSFSYPKYEMYTYEGIEDARRYSTAQWRFGALFKHLDWSDEIDSVLITRTEIKESKKNEHEYEQFGLVNFHSGKKIKTNYDEIIRRNLGNQTVYWASKYDDPHSRYYSRVIKKLDIYDSELNLIKRLENVEDLDFDYDRYHSKNFNAIIEINDLKGVIDAFGNEVIPLKFNECQIGRVAQNSSVPLVYYHCKINTNPKNTHEGIYSLFTLKGEMLIPSEYKHFSIQNELIFAMRERDKHDIFTFRGDLIFEGATSFANAREVKKDGQCIGQSYADKKLHTYIVKGDQLYHAFQGTLELYDAESFDFTQKYCYFLEWILIDQNAKVVTTDPVGISRRHKFYSNDYVKDCSTFFDVYPVPKKEAPKPVRPKPRAQITPTPIPTHQWKPGPSKNQSDWYLYSPDGKLKYETSFEFPTPVESYSGGIFRQNGKYGRFDRDFNIDLKAEYDYIHYSGFYAKKGNSWFFRKGESDEWSEGFDAITTRKRNNLRFVFLDGKIGLIDDSLNFSIPLTDSIDFIEKYDLVKILNKRGKYKETKRHLVDGIIYKATPSNVFQKINNFHIIEDAYLHSTANEIMEVNPADKEYPDLSSDLAYMKLKANETQIYRERIPTYFNQYFFSEITYTRSEKWYGSYLKGRHYADKTTSNYKIVNNELVPIALSDVLKSDTKSTEKLNEMILRELTEIQAYGDNCMDIASKIEALKANFLIRGSEIVFFGGVRGGFEIKLYFSELKPLFRQPKKMLIRY